MYIYATEMVSRYYRIFDLASQKVLSIIGSGDQIIGAYFSGAQEVVGVDINGRAIFMLDLKLSALNRLSYRCFLNFFGTSLDHPGLAYKTYLELRPGLKPSSRRFFDQAYRQCGHSGRRLATSKYLRQRQMMKAKAFEINGYLKNESSYVKCRRLLAGRAIRVFRLDINDLGKDGRVVGRFDLINLSNSLNYLTGKVSDEFCVPVIVQVISRAAKKLAPGGRIFSYSYSPAMYEDCGRKIPPASRLGNLRLAAGLSGLKFFQQRVKGINPGQYDRINIFQK